MPKGEVVAVSLQGLYDRLAIFVPNFIVAVIVLILGWMIGAALGGLVQKILETLKVDSLANTVGMDKLSERTGKKLSVATFGNWLVKWFFIIATFVAAAYILGLAQVGSFLYGQVIPYFGSVIVAVAIMLVGMIASNFMHGVVRHALQASGLRTSDSLALLTKWAILIFTFLAVLSELRVAETFVQDLFRAVVAMLAIAGGIAFGLGGRDHAKKILDSIEDDVTK